VYRALLLNRNCADTVSAVTHTSAVDKQVGEFTFNLASPAELDLEVTFLLTKTSGWFYSKYALEVVGDSGPTSSPIASPTVSFQCVDSPLKMLVNKRNRGCAWAAHKPSKRCIKPNIAQHCPLTCDSIMSSCSSCEDSNKKFVMKNSRFTKKCAFIGRDEDKIQSRCAKEGVLETCRVTCGYCDGF